MEGGREGWAWLMVREKLIGCRWMTKMIWSVRHWGCCLLSEVIVVEGKQEAGCKEYVNATNFSAFCRSTLARVPWH